jgi:hypothetical protein
MFMPVPPDMSLAFLFYIIDGLRLYIVFFMDLRLSHPELYTRDSNVECPIWYTHIRRDAGGLEAAIGLAPSVAWGGREERRIPELTLIKR